MQRQFPHPLWILEHKFEGGRTLAFRNSLDPRGPNPNRDGRPYFREACGIAWDDPIVHPSATTLCDRCSAERRTFECARGGESVIAGFVAPNMALRGLLGEGDSMMRPRTWGRRQSRCRGLRRDQAA